MWLNFWFGPEKRPAKHPLGLGPLLPDCNRFPIANYLLVPEFRYFRLRIHSSLRMVSLSQLGFYRQTTRFDTDKNLVLIA
jgi:hypothetical protein